MHWRMLSCVDQRAELDATAKYSVGTGGRAAFVRDSMPSGAEPELFG